MATPKRKTSHARTAQRKAQWLGSLTAPATLACPRCGEIAMTNYQIGRASCRERV